MGLLFQELEELLQNRVVDFKTTGKKSTKEVRDSLPQIKLQVLLNDAMLYINELRKYIAILKDTPLKINDPLNAMPMTEDEINVGFMMIFKSQLSIFSKMFSKTFVRIVSRELTFRDQESSLHSSYTLKDLADKSAKPLLKFYAAALQVIYSTILVLRPHQCIEILSYILPYYEYCKHTVQHYRNISKLQVPSEQRFVMNFHLDALWHVSYAVCLSALGYSDASLEHWKRALSYATAVGHSNTICMVWGCMSMLKYYNEETFSISEVMELKSVLVGPWRPYSTFLLAASVVQSAQSNFELTEGHTLLVKSMDEAIQVYGSMNDLSIRGRSLPVWLKTEPRLGLKIVEGMIARAEKTGVTSSMLLCDLYRFKAEMMLKVYVDSLEEIEEIFNYAKKLAIEGGFLLSIVKILRSLVKLYAVKRDYTSLKVTLSELSVAFSDLKKSNTSVNIPSVLKDVDVLLKINGLT